MSSAKNVLHGAATEDEEGKGGESTRGASLKITVKRAPSSTDTVRRGSEPRILGDADDLRLAVQVALRQSESAKLGGGGGAEKEKAGNTDLPAGELDEDRERDGGSFEYSHGITSAEAEKRLLLYGPNELPEKVIPKVTKHFLKCRRSPAIDLPPPPCPAVVHLRVAAVAAHAHFDLGRCDHRGRHPELDRHVRDHS